MRAAVQQNAPQQQLHPGSSAHPELCRAVREGEGIQRIYFQVLGSFLCFVVRGLSPSLGSGSLRCQGKGSPFCGSEQQIFSAGLQQRQGPVSKAVGGNWPRLGLCSQPFTLITFLGASSRQRNGSVHGACTAGLEAPPQLTLLITINPCFALPL